MDALEENETKYKKQVVVLPMRISKLQKKKGEASNTEDLARKIVGHA